MNTLSWGTPMHNARRIIELVNNIEALLNPFHGIHCFWLVLFSMILQNWFSCAMELGGEENTLEWRLESVRLLPGDDGILPLGLEEVPDAVHRSSSRGHDGYSFRFRRYRTDVPAIFCDMKSSTVALPSFQAWHGLFRISQGVISHGQSWWFSNDSDRRFWSDFGWH